MLNVEWNKEIYLVVEYIYFKCGRGKCERTAIYAERRFRGMQERHLRGTPYADAFMDEEMTGEEQPQPFEQLAGKGRLDQRKV